MKNAEQGLRERVVRRLPVWFLVGTLACVGVGGLLVVHNPTHRESARAQLPPASTDQSLEIDKLKQAVAMLEHKSAALALAVASPQREAERRPTDNELPTEQETKDTRSPAEIQQAEITELEVRFTAEKDGSRESLLAAQTMQAELRAAPLNGARITDVACSTSICRATLEQDVNAKPVDMTALIESTPSVRRESMFDYAQEGTVKRVTIYSAREGQHLNPSPPERATESPAR